MFFYFIRFNGYLVHFLPDRVFYYCAFFDIFCIFTITVFPAYPCTIVQNSVKQVLRVLVKKTAVFIIYISDLGNTEAYITHSAEN